MKRFLSFTIATAILLSCFGAGRPDSAIIFMKNN